MVKNPLNQLSPGIIEAIEQTPEFVASSERASFIPTTWGHLASRLIEDDAIAEPSIDAVCDFLAVSPQDFNDSENGIFSDADVRYFHDRIVSDREAKYRASYEPLARQDEEQLAGIIGSRQIEDGHLKADQVQDEIDLNFRTQDAKHDKTFEDTQALLCLKRDILEDGFMISLEDFSDEILKLDQLHYFSTDDIDAATQDMLKEVAREYVMDEKNMPSGINLGTVQIEDFTFNLKEKFASNVRDHVKDSWAIIAPYITPEPIEEHPVLTGSEQ